MQSWTCTVCQIQMHTNDSPSHLNGRKHAMAAQDLRQESDNFQNAQPESHSEYIANRDVNFTSPKSPDSKHSQASIGPYEYIGPVHPASASGSVQTFGTTDVSAWICTMCSCTVPLSTQQAHLTSSPHIARLLESIEATYSALPPPQYPRGTQSQAQDHSIGLQESLAHQGTAQEVITAFKACSLKPCSSKTEIPKITFAALNSPQASIAPHLNYISKTEAQPLTCPDRRTAIASHPGAMNSSLSLHQTAPSTGGLDAFFLSFSGYRYDPSAPPTESFKRLRRYLPRCHDWDGNSPSTWKDYINEVFTRYQTALTQEFNLWFGTDDDIGAWHSLCRVIKIQPLPTTCKECKEASRDKHVNIVDLIEWARNGEVGEVQLFKSVGELSSYSYSSSKIYRKDQLRQGVVLRHLLRRIASER